MSSIEADLPDVILQGEDLEKEWDHMISFSRYVMDNAGVVIKKVQEDSVGEYLRIAL